MVASSSGVHFRKHAVLVAVVKQVGKRDVDRLLDRDGQDFAPGALRLDPLGPRCIGDDQLGIGERERMLHFVRFPPAVDEGRDRPGLEDGHVADDP